LDPDQNVFGIFEANEAAQWWRQRFIRREMKTAQSNTFFPLINAHSTPRLFEVCSSQCWRRQRADLLPPLFISFSLL
jgi:hypothetical protein